MHRTMFVVAALAAIATTGQALAGTPYPQKMKCAVGGKSFTHTGTMSYSTYGARPDGKPYGSWIFPIPLPECPDNGLVMYREFTKDEVARLTALIASDAYRARIAADSSYYRAAWLERELTPTSDGVPWLLLSASWQVDDTTETKARYQREFVALVKALPPPAPDTDARTEWLVLQARAANALRELGDFDAAAAQIRSISTADLDVVVPEATADNQEAVDRAENRRGLLRYLNKLDAVVARRDAASEPLDMLPDRIAADLCLDAKEGADALQPAGFCKQPEVAKAMAEIAKYR